MQASVLGMFGWSLERAAIDANSACAFLWSVEALFSSTVRRVFRDQTGTRVVSYRIRSAYGRYAWCNPYRYRMAVDNIYCAITGSTVSVQHVQDLGLGYSDGSRAKNIE